MRIFTADEIDNQIYFKVPKSLFSNGRYDGLSLDSKMVYAILRDRMELSRKNNWINANNEVYLKYKREDIMEFIGCNSKTTITKIMKQLNNFKLIFEKRLGQGSTNEIYICHVETMPIPEVHKVVKQKSIKCTSKSTESVRYSKTNVNETDINETTTEPPAKIVVAPLLKNNEDTVSDPITASNDDIMSSITKPLPKGILPKHVIKLANRKELKSKTKTEIIAMINSALAVVKNYNNPRSTPAILTSAVMEGYDSPVESNLPGLELKQVQEHFKQKELEWNKATTEGSTVNIGALIAGLRSKHGMPVETELKF